MFLVQLSNIKLNFLFSLLKSQCSLFDSLDRLCFVNSKRHKKPKEGSLSILSIFLIVKLEPEKVVDDLHPTEDGEASEKTHGATY